MRSNAFIRWGCSVAASVLLIVLFGLGMAITARHPAIANISMDAAIDGLTGRNAGDGDHIDAPEVPVPVMGAELFFGSDARACLNRDVVVGHFLQDRSAIGGRVFSLADGMEQRFSNTWRASVGAEKITISGIVAHMFFDRVSDEWTADVVELDQRGCAISRTLLAGDAFNELLATLARQVERFRAGYEASNDTMPPTFDSGRTPPPDQWMLGSFLVGPAAAGALSKHPPLPTSKHGLANDSIG
jgi:hypothetical protein